MKNVDWKMVIIFLFMAVTFYLIGKGVDSRYVQNLQIRVTQLEVMKAQTEQLITRGTDENTKGVFRRLGYNIPAAPDTSRAN